MSLDITKKQFLYSTVIALGLITAGILSILGIMFAGPLSTTLGASDENGKGNQLFQYIECQ